MHRWWLRLGVSAAAAAVLLAFVPVDLVWNAIRGVRPWVWVSSVAVFVAGHAMNAVKLRLLLGPGSSTIACLQAHFTGMAANLGLPGVAGGDIVRAAYLAPSSGTSRVALAAVADRVVDSAVLLLIVVAASTVAGLPITAPAASDAPPVNGVRAGVIVITVAALMWIVWATLRRRPAALRMREAWSDMRRRPGAVLLAALISAGVQAVFVLTNVRLAAEVGLQTALSPWFLGWTASKLSAILPISLGGIGVREATLVSVLGAYGAPADGVLATGLLWEGAIVVGSLGGFLALQFTRRGGPSRRSMAQRRRTRVT
jgi:uncharacterized membrane protein YbhN (UPF0104 family)